MSPFSALLLELLLAWASGHANPGQADLGAASPSAPVGVERSTYAAAPAPRIDWVSLPRGDFTPLFPTSPGETRVTVGAFELARTAVTNRQFAVFVASHPEWRRDRVSSLFADGRYLAHWAGPEELAEGTDKRPVTNVSWFAARAFCADAGGRLPTEVEWERAAAASRTAADGRKDPEWSRAALEWYAAPATEPERDVGLGKPNFWGIRDLQGLVWEWVLDFNSIFVTGDSRDPRSTDQLKFCGGGAIGASDPENYASFMRLAILSSLEARFTVRHLGFRCARDARKDDR